MIRIETKNDPAEFSKSCDIVVTEADGTEIKNISKIELSIKPNDLVVASLEIWAGKLNVWAHDNRIYLDQYGNRFIRANDHSVLKQIKFDEDLAKAIHLFEKDMESFGGHERLEQLIMERDSVECQFKIKYDKACNDESIRVDEMMVLLEEAIQLQSRLLDLVQQIHSAPSLFDPKYWQKDND